jgi:hypothetical protein
MGPNPVRVTNTKQNPNLNKVRIFLLLFSKFQAVML